MKKRLFVLKNADGKYVSIDQIHEDYLSVHTTTNIAYASMFNTFDEAEIEAQNISNGRYGRFEYLVGIDDIPIAIEEVVIETMDLLKFIKQ